MNYLVYLRYITVHTHNLLNYSIYFAILSKRCYTFQRKRKFIRRNILILNIGKHNFMVIEKGVYYFDVSDYPHLNDYELNNIIAFISYEKAHGRQTEIVCNNKIILSIIMNATAHIDGTEYIAPNVIGNVFVYHATDIFAAQQILFSGKLLSAAKVYGKSGQELAHEKRESSWNDPTDYFEYIMFCWGDTPTGDYVVLSEDPASKNDLIKGNFNAGIRFYFRYGDIIRHPKHVFDGYHAIKVKDEIALSDYLFACIVPKQFKNELQEYVPQELAAKVHYLSQKGIGLVEWNEKVFHFAISINNYPD